MEDEEKSSFACDECDQSFSKARGLTIHRAKMHKKKKSAREEKSPGPQKNKKEVAGTPDEQEESSSSREVEEKSVKKNKKAASPKKEKGLFKVGAVLEGENNDPELPLYLDTIHEVEYVGPSKDAPDTHRCRMPAFHGRPIYEWDTHELHEKRQAKEKDKEEFQVGEKVHVLIKNRWGIDEKGERVNDLDGHSAKVGVWVKAEVVEIDKGTGLTKVEHAAWNISDKKKKRIQTSVGKNEIRKDWTK